MPNTITQSRQLKSTLGDLLRSLEDGEKAANFKKSAGLKNDGLKKKADEPETTHPVGSADDGTQPYPEGSHATELTSVIKEDQPLGVEQATPNDSGSQNDVQTDIGLTSKATGTDPAVEDEYKDRPEDPGTSSDVDTSVGEKYSEKRAQLDQLVKTSEATGSAFLAVLNKLAGGEGQIAGSMGSPTAKPTDQDPAKTPSPANFVPEDGAVKDAVAGFEVASALQDLPTEDKEAAISGIHNIMRETVKHAVQMATKTAEYLYGLEAGLKKTAEGPPMEGPPPEEAGPPAAEGEGGPPPEEGGGGGGEGGLSEEDLAQLLMQGEGMPGPGGGEGGGGGGGLEELLAGAGGGGGAPEGGDGGLEALMAGGGGGDMGGGGGPPDMGGGGGGPPGAGGDIDPAMLQAVLQEMGANPEQLEKAMAAKQAAMKKQAQQNAVRTKIAQQNRTKFGPKYDQVKKAVADLLGRRVA